MSDERAHPDSLGFQYGWAFRLRRGIVPWLSYRPKSPYRLELEWRYQWVNQYCRGLDVLDVPCGMGWGTSMLRGCRSIVGLDRDAKAVEEAVQRYGRHASFRVGDMAALDLPDSSIDVVVCLEGIEHVPVDVGARFMSEASRVLRSGGLLLISSPCCLTRAHSGNPHHVHEYQPDEIVAALSARFLIEEKIHHDVDIMRVHYFRARKAGA